MPTDYPVSWFDIHNTSITLSKKLADTGKKWDRIIAVTRGGMIPACLVACNLDIRVIDTVSVKSYDFQNQSNGEILKLPVDVGTGKNCLIIDDLTDTGNTFKLLRKILPDASYACLYAKPEGKDQTDYFVTETKQDEWIFFPWDDREFPPHIRALIGMHLKE